MNSHVKLRARCVFAIALLLSNLIASNAFVCIHPVTACGSNRFFNTAQKNDVSVVRSMAQVSQEEATKGIDKVVTALRKDKSALEELGRLDKVANVLGFGAPTPGTIAVRFNASFKKAGPGFSSVPLPFGLGQSNKSEGRGQMVGQVKASIDAKTGKIQSCSVFRDLGYGRAFNLRL